MNRDIGRISFSPMDWHPFLFSFILGGGAVVYVLEWFALDRLVGAAVACQMVGVVAMRQWRLGKEASVETNSESEAVNSAYTARDDAPSWWILMIGVVSLSYGVGAWAFGRIFGFITGSAALFGVIGSVSNLSLDRRVRNGLQFSDREGEEPPNWWKFVFAFVFIVGIGSLWLVVNYQAASPWGYFVIAGCMIFSFLVRTYIDGVG